MSALGHFVCTAAPQRQDRKTLKEGVVGLIQLPPGPSLTPSSCSSLSQPVRSNLSLLPTKRHPSCCSHTAWVRLCQVGDYAPSSTHYVCELSVFLNQDIDQTIASLLSASPILGLAQVIIALIIIIINKTAVRSFLHIPSSERLTDVN